MRISDWSSDVCSSDLQATIRQTFAEAVPELQALYKKQREEGIELIKSSGAKVRVLSDEEKATLRERAFEPTKEVSLDRPGEVGAELMALYEQEHEKINSNGTGEGTPEPKGHPG